MQEAMKKWQKLEIFAVGDEVADLKAGDKEFTFDVGYDLEDPDEVKKAEKAKYNLSEFIEANTSVERKEEMLSKGLIGANKPAGTIQGGKTR